MGKVFSTGPMALVIFAMSACDAARDEPRVELTTSAGEFTIAVDVIRVPLVGCAFLRAVGKGAYNGGVIEETIMEPASNGERRSVGIEARHNDRAIEETVQIERASVTGLRFEPGVVILSPDENGGGVSTAAFGILTRRPGHGADEIEEILSVTAFGRVVSGMATVSQISERPIRGLDNLEERVDIQMARLTGDLPTLCVSR